MPDITMFTKLFEYGLLGIVLAGVGWIAVKLGGRAIDIVSDHLKENNAIHKDFVDKTSNHFDRINNELVSIKENQRDTNHILNNQTNILSKLSCSNNGKQ